MQHVCRAPAAGKGGPTRGAPHAPRRKAAQTSLAALYGVARRPLLARVLTVQQLTPRAPQAACPPETPRFPDAAPPCATLAGNDTPPPSPESVAAAAESAEAAAFEVVTKEPARHASVPAPPSRAVALLALSAAADGGGDAQLRDDVESEAAAAPQPHNGAPAAVPAAACTALVVVRAPSFDAYLKAAAPPPLPRAGREAEAQPTAPVAPAENATQSYDASYALGEKYWHPGKLAMTAVLLGARLGAMAMTRAVRGARVAFRNAAHAAHVAHAAARAAARAAVHAGPMVGIAAVIVVGGPLAALGAGALEAASLRSRVAQAELDIEMLRLEVRQMQRAMRAARLRGGGGGARRIEIN